MALQIIGYAVSITSVILSFFLGKWQNIRSEKRKALSERYESLYVPFISWVYITRPWECTFSSLPTKNRNDVIQLLLNNIHHLDAESVCALQEMYHTDVFLMFFEKTGETELSKFFGEKAKEELDAAFCRLTKMILRQSINISRKLYKPEFASPALTRFAQSGHK